MELVVLGTIETCYSMPMPYDAHGLHELLEITYCLDLGKHRLGDGFVSGEGGCNLLFVHLVHLVHSFLPLSFLVSFSSLFLSFSSGIVGGMDELKGDGMG